MKQKTTKDLMLAGLCIMLGLALAYGVVDCRKTEKPVPTITSTNGPATPP